MPRCPRRPRGVERQAPAATWRKEPPATSRLCETALASARDPEVGVARLARAVDRAAHHGDLERLHVGAESLLDLHRELLDPDVVAAAARARDHHRAALAQAQRLEDLPGDLDLLDRV